jgi:predicted aspartyl protease
MLFFGDRTPFATGMMEYQYRPVTEQEGNTRLMLRVELDELAVLAVVDTGAPYVVLAPQFADLLQLNPDNALEDVQLKIRGIDYRGHIHRVPLQFSASEGTSLRIEATVFIPEVGEEAWGSLPSFLGMMGCLERLRFAIDPTTDTFYFGSLAEE